MGGQVADDVQLYAVGYLHCRQRRVELAIDVFAIALFCSVGVGVTARCALTFKGEAIAGNHITDEPVVAQTDDAWLSF